MSVTKQILELAPFKIYNEGKWDQKKLITELEPGYTSFNDAGLECETGELLYAFTRIIQPERVLETGTHVGVGASYIGLGLRDNQKGHLDTLEFISELHDRAKSNLKALNLEEWVTCHLTDATKWEPVEFRGSDFSDSDYMAAKKKIYDLILLDTEPQTRFEELCRYFYYLKEGGYIFIHDLHRHMHQIENEEHGFAWPYGPLPDLIKNWVKEDVLRPFHFGTPRGLTGFYKVHPGDYKW